MTEQEIYEKLTTLCEKAFNRENLTITAETSAKDIAEWTSLTYMTLVFDIEETFAFRVKLKDMMAWKNVGDIVATISKRVNGN